MSKSKIIFLLIFIIIGFFPQKLFSVYACTPGETSACLDQPGTCCNFPGSEGQFCCNFCTCPNFCKDTIQYFCDDTGNWTWDCCIGSGCFTGEAEIGIKDTRGTEKTGEIKEIEDLQPGEIVSSFDPETGEIKEGTVSDVQKLTREGYFELETETGEKVKVTAEHPFLAVKNKSFIAKIKEVFSQTLTYRVIAELGSKLNNILR